MSYAFSKVHIQLKKMKTLSEFMWVFQHYASNPKIKAIENALEEGGNTREGNCSDIITYIKSVVNSNKPVKVKQEVNNDNGASEIHFLFNFNWFI